MIQQSVESRNQWELHCGTASERQQHLHGELKVHHVTIGEEETGSFIIDRIIDSSIWDVFQGLQILSQPFKANTLHPLRKGQLSQNVEPAHRSVVARAGNTGCLWIPAPAAGNVWSGGGT